MKTNPPNNPAPTNGPISPLRRGALWLAVLILPGALTSCATRAVQVETPVALPKAFSLQGDQPTAARWWTAFEDATLNSLIDRALRGNFSLRTAWDRLDQARAAAVRSGAGKLPTLDATAGVGRTVRGTHGAGRTYSTDFSLGLVASYEVDLWGRVRSTHDATRLDVHATSEDLHAAAITLVSEVASTWFKLIELHGQLNILDEQIETNEKFLEVITLKFRRGQVSAADVLQQRQLVESNKGNRVLVESSVTVLQHSLAVLLGQAPGTLTVDIPTKLPTLAALPRTGLPVEWVRRRPDVRAAELRVQAADRRVAAAIADRLPRLSLSVGVSTSAERTRDLFDNWLANIAANLIGPLFDGSSRRAEVERTKAVVSERLNSFGQVVLTSLAEVENALSQETKQAAYVASLHRQMELSRKATDQTLENYTKGVTDFTRYLTTLLSHQRLQRTHLQAQRELVLFRIALHRALAGGWELSRPPRAKVAGPPKTVKNPHPEATNNKPAAQASPERR